MNSLSDFLGNVKGRWIAIGGNRWISKKTSREVGKVTRSIIRRGYHIVTGGAEGVDHAAMRACLGCQIRETRLKVFLPYTIKGQYEHYRKLEGARKAKGLLNTLEKIKRARADAIIENQRKFKNYRQAADFRNTLILRRASGCIVFNPGRSRGSLDALRKIRVKGKPYIILQ